MDIDQLLAFDRVVREGSFSRAAWALGVGQPAVSARIQALERAVGGPLFVRGVRGAMLTDVGASFLPYARRAIEVLDAGVEIIRQSQEGHHGRVSIGVLESLSGHFLGPLLGQFHHAYPLVEVRVRAGRHEQVIELLRDGVVSMALTAWPCPEMIVTELEPMVSLCEPVVLAVAHTHTLAQSSLVSIEQVAAEARPFLVMRWWLSLPMLVTQIAQLAQATLDVPMDTGRQMVLSGTGAAFFPWMQVAEQVAAGQLRAVTLAGNLALSRESALVRRVGAAPLSPATATFVAMLRERAGQLGILSA
ncbi:MAG: LysR family transcriptional regulator [Oscillochloris sp.]|nr:LysR family transcriptional regulator [Oscillochloris sp.]